jgi:hypothetical protein
MEKPRFSRVWKLSEGSDMQLMTECERWNSDVLLLRTLDVHEHAVEPEYTLLKSTSVVRNLARLCRRLAPGFALNHDVEIDELVRQGRHVVLEAEPVLSHSIRSQDVVTLPLALPVEENLVVGILDFEVDIEGPSRLDLRPRLTLIDLHKTSSYSEVKLSLVSVERHGVGLGVTHADLLSCFIHVGIET